MVPTSSVKTMMRVSSKQDNTPGACDATPGSDRSEADWVLVASETAVKAREGADVVEAIIPASTERQLIVMARAAAFGTEAEL